MVGTEIFGLRDPSFKNLNHSLGQSKAIPNCSKNPLFGI